MCNVRRRPFLSEAVTVCNVRRRPFLSEAVTVCNVRRRPFLSKEDDEGVTSSPFLLVPDQIQPGFKKEQQADQVLYDRIVRGQVPFPWTMWIGATHEIIAGLLALDTGRRLGSRGDAGEHRYMPLRRRGPLVPRCIP